MISHYIFHSSFQVLNTFLVFVLSFSFLSETAVSWVPRVIGNIFLALSWCQREGGEAILSRFLKLGFCHNKFI